MCGKSSRQSHRSRTGLSRREFSKILAVGAASAALPAGVTATTAVAPGGCSSLLRDAPELAAESEAQYKVLISRYGARLSDEQKADARRLIDQGLKSTVPLRSFQLDNTDEPANIFRARLMSQG